MTRGHYCGDFGRMFAFSELVSVYFHLIIRPGDVLNYGVDPGLVFSII